MKKNNGITLIALVITIIVLLILAGVSINMITGNDGIISKASNAAEKTKTNSSDEEQKLKDTSAYIDEKVNQFADSNSSLSHSGTVPEGAYYANLNTGTFYDVMPDTVSDGDIYLYGDYMYQYGSSNQYWSVHLATAELGIQSYIPNFPVTNRNQISYGTILENINGIHIGSLTSTFKDCTSLITSPKIPSTVTGLLGAYSGCTSLTTAPKLPQNLGDLDSTFENCTSLTDLSDMVIPSSVFCMNGTFSGCTNLITAPTIPNANTEMATTFKDCISLTGNIEINATPTRYEGCFEGTIKPITLTGSSEYFAELASTANNSNITY